MPLRWDSPIVLSIAGTVALHILLLVGADVLTEYVEPPKPPTPVLEWIEIEPPPVANEPPPLPEPPAPEPEPEVKPPDPPPAPEPKIAKTVSREPRTAEPPPTPETPPPMPADTPVDPTAGGPVVTLDSATGKGPPVAMGRPNPDRRIGRGGAGSGTGTGDGEGTGSGSAPPPPVSVATIKKRAKPKGDQSFLSVGKDYPAEAKQQGIEGVIRVRLVVTADGKVATAVLINKLGYGLDELALERAKMIEFEPAVDTDDKPVSSVVVWTFTMTLPK